MQTEFKRKEEYIKKLAEKNNRNIGFNRFDDECPL